MAIEFFLLLCGLGVTFLVYVFAQFWRDGHPAHGSAEVTVLSHPRNASMIVVTHPISLNAHGGISVMPLKPQMLRQTTSKRPATGRAQVLQMPVLERTVGARPNSRDAKTKVC